MPADGPRPGMTPMIMPEHHAGAEQQQGLHGHHGRDALTEVVEHVHVECFLTIDQNRGRDAVGQTGVQQGLEQQVQAEGQQHAEQRVGHVAAAG